MDTIYTGAEQEKDISVLITQAPRYGLVDDDIQISVRVDAYGASQKIKNELKVTAMQDGVVVGTYPAIPGEEIDMEFKLEHAGDTVFSFEVQKIDGECWRGHTVRSIPCWGTSFG